MSGARTELLKLSPFSILLVCVALNGGVAQDIVLQLCLQLFVISAFLIQSISFFFFPPIFCSCKKLCVVISSVQADFHLWFNKFCSALLWPSQLTRDSSSIRSIHCHHSDSSATITRHPCVSISTVCLAVVCLRHVSALCPLWPLSVCNHQPGTYCYVLTVYFHISYMSVCCLSLLYVCFLSSLTSTYMQSSTTACLCASPCCQRMYWGS